MGLVWSTSSIDWEPMSRKTPGQSASKDATVQPFIIDIDDGQLLDLKARLNNTRWPEAETVTAPNEWTQGTPLSYLQTLCTYWANSYNWREREARLNRFDQFTTRLEELSIHFIHQRSPHADATPIVTTHGGPG